MRSKGYCSCSLCVGVCVSVSVSRQLTSGVSVRLENAITYSTGNKGQKICGIFSEKYFVAEIRHFLHCFASVQAAICYAENMHA